jgi:multidrug efflux pump
VIDDVENVRQAAWMNETPAVIMNIQRQPGANIIQVVDRIKQLLPQLTDTLPKSIDVKILTDRTNTIRASVADVQFELMLTIVLVVMVIFCSCATWRRPSSPAWPFRSRWWARSGDVHAGVQPQQPDPDGADHLHRIRGGRRHRDDREHRPLHRRGRSAHEGGAEGRRADRLHHHLADHLADRGAHPAAVHGRHRGPPLPRIRRHPGGHHSGVRGGIADPDAHDVLEAAEAQAGGRQGRLYRASERAFEAIIALYGTMLRVVLRWQTITLLVAVGTLVLTCYQFWTIPKGFFPIQDTGVIQGVSEAAQTVSFPEMSASSKNSPS